MTTTTSLESTHIAIQAKVKFAGISQLSTDSVHLLEAYVGGGWQLKMYIPKAVPDDRKSSLVLFLNPILRSKIGAVDAIKISFSLESLRGEVHTTKTFKWELQGDKELAARNMVNWNKFWHENAAHRVDDGFFVRVSITSVSSRPTAFDPSILNTISQLTQGKNVFDTKFFSFSRPRYEYQGAQDPLPVYANSTFLRSQSDYFQTMFSGVNYTESKLVPLGTPPSIHWIEEYDYDSDSDLGYFSEDDDAGDGIELSDEALGDSIWQSKKTEEISCDITGGQDTKVSGPEPEVSGSAEIRPQVNCEGHSQNCGPKGRVITVKDTAYVTWRAMIFYLYTSQISFAPLSSCMKLRARSVSERDQGIPPRPSAKSMYRLADKLGLDDLCKLSLAHIQSQLSADNVIYEVFSAFTSHYKEVRDLELAFLFEHWEELKTSQKMGDVVDRVTSGDLPHAFEVLKTILAHSKHV